MIRILQVVPAMLLLILLPTLVSGQQDPARSANRAKQTKQPRAKIGVALEGGGALGLAHIGVLQWFEEHHIPVDYIAGTSMGGLVGGFYAVGISPDEQKKIIQRLDWDEILTDRTRHQDLSFLRKQDQR